MAFSQAFASRRSKARKIARCSGSVSAGGLTSPSCQANSIMFTDAMAALSQSTHFDWRLAPYDVLQTSAHARILHAAGLLSDDEAARVQEALNAIATEIAAGTLVPDPSDEDVHTAVERALIGRLGDLGGKLRAGRSRNDQVSTDFRMYLRDQVRVIALAVTDLQAALLGQAEEHVTTYSPGFTHLQHAQPVSFGHELAKHVHALGRDVERLADWDKRAARSPLGAGALAGSSLGLDPQAVALDLGFDEALANSIDATSDRDWVAEFLFAAAMIGVHLSRLGEEVILMASREFGWARLDDAWSTGSSIMPQKKNPDVAELARGKSGRLIGNLTGLMATLKGLPFGYNRDLQEAGPPGHGGHDRDPALRHRAHGGIRTRGLRARNRHRRVVGAQWRPVPGCPRGRRGLCAQGGVRGHRVVGSHR